MSHKKLSTKNKALSLEIRDFAHDAYDYICTQQTFSTKGVKEKFAEAYDLRCSLTEETRVSNFTEDIGNAIRITQFLLRDYFKNLFQFTIADERVFKEEAKLMWSHWLDNRTNIFVKVIDTLAIIAEAFLYIDRCKNVNLELNEMTEWFIEWFEEYLKSEFFQRGGWKRLNNLVLEWYVDIFETFKGYGVNLFYNLYSFEAVKQMYPCHLIKYLRHSPIKFPVPESALCYKCKLASDKNLYQRIIYVRLAFEIDACLIRTIFRRRKSPIKEQDEVKIIDLKSEQFVTKLEDKEELTTKDLPPNVPGSQIDEIRKDFDGGNFKDFSSIQNSSQFTSISKISNEADIYSRRVRKDSKSSIQEISTDDLSDIKLEESSDVQLEFPAKEPFSNNENLKSKQKIAIFGETFKHLKLDPFTEGNNSDLPQTEPADNEEEKDSSATSVVKIASLACINTKQNVMRESSPKEAAERLEQLTSDNSSASVPLLPESSPESSVNLNRTFSSEHFRSPKKALETEQFVEQISDKEPLNPSLINCDYYEAFMENFLRNIIQKDDQREGSENQNIYLISDLFSNTWYKLYEACKTNTLAEKIKALNLPECLLPPAFRDTKSKHQSNIPSDLTSLEFCYRDYNFYFIGEERIIETNKKFKKRRSRK